MPDDRSLGALPANCAPHKTRRRNADAPGMKAVLGPPASRRHVAALCLAKSRPEAGAPYSGLSVCRVPLHCLTAGEPWPASLRSGRKTEDLLYKGSLRRHVTPGHGTHLALGQHRQRFDAGQRPLRCPEALKAEPGPGQALDPAVVLLDPVIEPAPPPVPKRPEGRAGAGPGACSGGGPARPVY